MPDHAAHGEIAADAVERDVMEYDVVTVGAGPAGLAFAIRLKQLDPGQSGSPSTSSAPESRRMCARSPGPASAATGTTGVPERNPATTPINVSRVGVPGTATLAAPANRSASASARPASSAHDEVAPSTDTASG